MASVKETTSYDANSIEEGIQVSNNSFEVNMKYPVEDFSHGSNKLGFDMMMGNENNMLQDVVSDSNRSLSVDQMNWTEQEAGFRGGLLANNFSDHSYPPPTHEFLDLFNLSRCASASSFAPNSMISFAHSVPNFNTSIGFLGEHHSLSENMSASATLLYDPLYHMNPPLTPHQQPNMRDLTHSTLPRGYNFSGLNGSMFVEEGEREMIGLAYQEGREFESEVLEFTGEKPRKGKGKEGNATERKRRVEFSGKYDALKSLLPNPNKPDRASIVGEAIDYIHELKRTVSELTIEVEKKRCGKERNRRQGGGGGGDEDGVGGYNGSLRCSWVQRKSKNAEVDVRIIDDEVTIKLVQRKRINCLLLVSKLLDELQLDLQHAAGGHTGDFYSYLFNTKIYEGSSVYSTGIANRLLEAVERQYAQVPLSSKY